MIEQLKKWTELQPDCCKVHRIDEKLYFEIGDCVFQPCLSPLSVLVRGHRFEGDECNLWLRHVTENAITARGWEWEIGARKNIETGAIDFAANVWPTSMLRCVSSEWYTVPAEALLAVYLQALENGEQL